MCLAFFVVMETICYSKRPDIRHAFAFLAKLPHPCPGWSVLGCRTQQAGNTDLLVNDDGNLLPRGQSMHSGVLFLFGTINLSSEAHS
jgi:hypothetical protein